MNRVGFQSYKGLITSPLAVFAIIAAALACVAYALVANGIFSLHLILAAFGGLALGLAIEALTGPTSASRGESKIKNDRSIEDFEADHRALTAEYITTAAAVIQSVTRNWEQDKGTSRPLEEYLYNAAHLARRIVDTDELSDQEVQLVLNSQRLLASYVLAPSFRQADEFLEPLMNHLGSLSLVGSLGDKPINELEPSVPLASLSRELEPSIERTLANNPNEPIGKVVPVNEAEQQGSVLIIEEEAPVRAFASRALQIRGYRVMEAPDVQSAIRLIEDTDLEIDLVIFDHHFVSVDQAFTMFKEKLETLRPDVKKIAIANTPVTDNKIEGAELLAKPFSNEELASATERVLH